MKIPQENTILINKSLSVKAIWCTSTVELLDRQRLETWKHRQSAEDNPQDDNCPATRQL